MARTEMIAISASAFMEVHILDGDSPRPFVLVCPGGGYFFCNPRETDKVAAAFNGKGFDSAVLFYSTGKDDHYPKQLVELATAVDMIRKRKTVKGLFVCGFSAGGHLAASLGTLRGKEPMLEGLDCRVDGLILSYAVTVSGKFENKRTFDELCGDSADLRRWTSLVDKVDSNTPKCFIWHTYEDALVPVENALMFASALRKNGVPFELHVFEKGPHALSLATEATAECDEQIDPHAASWFDLASEWIEDNSGINCCH